MSNPLNLNVGDSVTMDTSNDYIRKAFGAADVLRVVEVDNNDDTNTYRLQKDGFPQSFWVDNRMILGKVSEGVNETRGCFKVGDKVRLKESFVQSNQHMWVKETAGKVLTVKKVSLDGSTIYVEENDYSFVDEWLDSVGINSPQVLRNIWGRITGVRGPRSDTAAGITLISEGTLLTNLKLD